VTEAYPNTTFTFETSSFSNQNNVLPQPTIGVPVHCPPQAEVLAQPTTGVPVLPCFNPTDLARNSRLVQHVIQIITLQNTLLQEILAVY